MKQYVISEEDCKKMLQMFEQKSALENLILIKENNELVSNNELYQKFLKDYTAIKTKYDAQWDYLKETYNIPLNDGEYMNMDFGNNMITIQS